MVEPVGQTPYDSPIITKQWVDTPQSYGPDSQPTSNNAYALAYLYKKDYGTFVRYSVEVYTRSLVGTGGGLHFYVVWLNDEDGYVDLYDGRHFFKYTPEAVDIFQWIGYSREGRYFD